MGVLIAVLWAVYLSECFARWRPGNWIFRETFAGVHGVCEPDVTFLDGRVAFVWTSPWPGHVAHVAVGRALGVEKAADVARRFRRAIVWSRVGSVLLFTMALVVFPALVLTERILPWLHVVAIAFAIAWVWTFGTYWLAHRAIYRRGPGLESWLVLALSPVSLIRAPATLAWGVFGATHPVTVAAALCGDGEFLRIARLWHFDHPELASTIRQLVAARGLEAQLTAPPASPEAGVSVYCPRCHATFAASALTCVDCDGVDLRSLGGDTAPDRRRFHHALGDLAASEGSDGGARVAAEPPV